MTEQNTTRDAFSVAAQIVGNAIDDANRLINEANGKDGADIVTGWAVVIGITTVDGFHGTFELYPGCSSSGIEPGGQPSWATWGLFESGAQTMRNGSLPRISFEEDDDDE